MIIVKVQGGLGNQMQQYALYRKLKKQGKNVKLDISWFEDAKLQERIAAPRQLELRYFQDLPMDLCTEAEAKKLTGGDSLFAKVKKKLAGNSKVFEESRMYHPEIFDMEEKYLTGYFACNKYYADILPELKELFRFPVSSDAEGRRKNELTIQEMERSDEISVSIHLRRGDYLDAINADILGGICTPAYYAGAVRYLEENAASALGRDADTPLHFYVFSDDPEYARSLSFGSRGEQMTVCDWNTGSDNLLDMELMAHCRCCITANSTFSFWGARLNRHDNAVLIRPLYHRNNQKPDPEQMHDYWKGYVLLDRDGSIA